MSGGPNHRRGHGRITDNGPTWESHTPAAGCNSTHVARARAGWKKIDRRRERRAGGEHWSHSGQGQKSRYKIPPMENDE